MAIDNSGKYLVTTGADRKLKVFDLRKYQELNDYYLHSAANAMSVSQRGLVAVGFGPNVHILKNPFTSQAPTPYMTHQIPGTQVSSLAFQPFEDVLSIGHASGVANIVIPGAGEPNFDTFEANPYENAKQRGETEVRSLLEKLRPEMITLDPRAIGRVDLDPATEQLTKIQQMEKANGKPLITKKKMRGRNRPSRRLRKKQQNVVDLQKEKYKDMLENAKKREERRQQQAEWEAKAQSAPTALNRFFKK
jgi:U3 small nucleolar RNA-associated protein 7